MIKHLQFQGRIKYLALYDLKGMLKKEENWKCTLRLSILSDRSTLDGRGSQWRQRRIVFWEKSNNYCTHLLDQQRRLLKKRG